MMLLGLVGCGADLAGDAYPPLMPGADIKGDVLTWQTELRPGDSVPGSIARASERYPITLRRGDTVKLSVDTAGLSAKLVGEGSSESFPGTWRISETKVYEVRVSNETKNSQTYTLSVACLDGPCQDDPQWRHWKDEYEDNNTRDQAAIARLGHQTLTEGFGHARWKMVSLDQDDVDWFQVNVKDTREFGDPAVTIKVVGDDAKFIEATAYYKCDYGNSRPHCASGNRVHDENGRGCSAIGPDYVSKRRYDLAVEADCRGTTDESGVTYLRAARTADAALKTPVLRYLGNFGLPQRSVVSDLSDLPLDHE